MEKIAKDYREQRNACFIILDETKRDRDKCTGGKDAAFKRVGEMTKEVQRLMEENANLKSRKIPKRTTWLAIGAGLGLSIAGGVILFVAVSK